jgi:hypothetical protein
MNSAVTAQYRSWFTRYVRSHESADEQDQRNIRLKEEHTRRVCDNTLLITRGLGLDAGETALAETIALFHDVGRFPQYRQYKTFQDGISVNHAALGARVLLEENVLHDLPKREQELIVRAVTLHNVFSLPEGLDERTLLFARLVRDADKLDIWRVFIEYCRQDPADRPSAAGLGLPDTPEYSPAVLDSLRRREMVTLASLRNLNDFKLLQLAWIFDLNFVPSLNMVRERGVIDLLSATVPRTGEVIRSLDAVRQYVDERVDGTRP